MKCLINQQPDVLFRSSKKAARCQLVVNYGESHQRGNAAGICLHMLGLSELFDPLIAGIGAAYKAPIIITNDADLRG